MNVIYTTHASPIGELLLVGDEAALRAIHLPGLHARRPGWRQAGEPFAPAAEQLDEYFAGTRREFELPLAPAGGSAFDRAVWKRVTAIPYGETASYGSVARDIGHPDRARAVGGSNARNPLPIVVPCHRVIGTDGKLTGYAGGLGQKRSLLALESGVQTLL